jgi:hypothetical protein
MRAGADVMGGTLSGVPYGSDAWLRLDEDHPAMLGATVLSAECWYRYGLYLREDLTDAGAILDYILAHRIRQASWDVAGSPELWAGLRLADIQARAGEAREALGL